MKRVGSKPATVGTGASVTLGVVGALTVGAGVEAGSTGATDAIDTGGTGATVGIDTDGVATRIDTVGVLIDGARVIGRVGNALAIAARGVAVLGACVVTSRCAVAVAGCAVRTSPAVVVPVQATSAKARPTALSFSTHEQCCEARQVGAI